MAKNYVTVEMLVDTAYQGPRKMGDVISVPEDFANRWVKNGIAKRTSAKPEAQAKAPVEEPAQVDEYAELTAKDLFNMCKEKGIDVEAKKSKEYYIEKLNG